MNNTKKLIVSHAPFLHVGSNIVSRNYTVMLAALPAVLFGVYQYGMPAVGVIALAVSSAIWWELLMNVISRQPRSIGDGNAALIGLLFAMMLPAVTPWWAVLAGTFLAVVIGKYIFGGIGGNPFNPVLIGVAVLMVSWGGILDFDEALVHYRFDFAPFYPLAGLKSFGPGAVDQFGALDLLLGQQVGGIGATFGLGLIAGGIFLILKGIVRWEIPVAFLLGVFITAGLFYVAAPDAYAGPIFHLLTGYTLIGAFFLAPEDSSSPVNTLPMLVYGAGAGIMAVLIRNIGAYVDGVVLAILLMNILNPLVDRIRPKALGKVG